MMENRKNEAPVVELLSMLESALPGIAIEIGRNARWEQPTLTFRWAGFVDMLPEERFRRLCLHIPEEFRETRLKEWVWVELALDETVDAFLQLPRSEDVADREAEIYGRLVKEHFFELLHKALGPAPESKCAGDFSLVKSILSKRNFSREGVHDAKLTFIRHGAYCDCQALLTAKQSLADQHAGAA